MSGLIRSPQYSLAATAVLTMIVGGEAKEFRLLSLENKAAYLWIDVMTVAGVWKAVSVKYLTWISHQQCTTNCQQSLEQIGRKGGQGERGWGQYGRQDLSMFP